MESLTTVNLLNSRRTKIIATLGPASADEAKILALLRAGVGVFRLNMSHGSHDWHRSTYEKIRQVTGEEKAPAAVLVDLSGTKIRAGVIQKGWMEIQEGDTVTVTTREVEGEPGLIPCQYPGLTSDIKEGDRILLDDGNLSLDVVTIEGTEVECRVRQGGILRQRTGMHLPGVHLSTPALTEKDKEDVEFALDLGVDLLALSFVRRPGDVEELKERIRKSGGHQGVIAKIEKVEALEEIDAIIEASDGVLVARGDLGVELEPERIPVIQNQLVDKCRARAKPVIIATQMLESMAEHTRPTRAEVTDVAQAVSRGADAVMLSRETALGQNPVLAVEMMDKIARHAESYLWTTEAFGSLKPIQLLKPPLPVEDALARATALLSRDLLTRSIMVISHSGTTACMVSSARPAAPILAFTSEEKTWRQMNLLWGVIPVKAEPYELEEPKGLGRRIVQEYKLAAPGDPILMVRGFHQDPRRNAPSVTVFTV